MPAYETIKALIKSLVHDLAKGKYEDISKDGRIGRLTKKELIEAIRSYGGEVTLPPEKEFNSIEIYQVMNSQQFSVDFDLWVDGQKSDLTLSCTVIININGKAYVAIDDLHVL